MSIRNHSFLVIIALSFSSLLTSAFEYEFESNPHPRAWGVVEENRVYRSGHPRGDQFSFLAEKYNLKSLLVLTGSMAKELSIEMEYANKKGIATLFLPISDKEPLSDENLFKIVQFLKDAPKPLLMHCRAGADRTGLVSAIYRHLFMDSSLVEAKKDMLSLRWGHLSFGPTAAMDKYFLEVFPTKIEALQNAITEVP